MSRPLSNEKRIAIIKHKEAGASNPEISKWLFICERTVRRIWGKYKATGSYEPKPPNSGRKPLVSEETMELIVARIKEQPDITLTEMIEEFKLPISTAALSKRLTKLGLTYKKRLSSRAVKREKT